jgi:hypothetical protein
MIIEEVQNRSNMSAVIFACQGSHSLAYAVCDPWPDTSPLSAIDSATVRSHESVYAFQRAQ